MEQIDAGFNLLHAPLHLGAGKVPSRLFTALNLLPSTATTACENRFS